MQAINLISDALAEIGVIGAGETPSGDDSAFCLRKLNQVVQRWSNSPLMLTELKEVSVPLTGASSYTVGPTGVVVADRPLSVEWATSVDAQGVERKVDVLSREQWDAIVIKNVTGGLPWRVWYEANPGNGVLHVYPINTGFTIKLKCLSLITSFPDTSTDVDLPEGYESALTLTLAEDIATAYGTQATPSTVARARAARSAVKSTNLDPMLVRIDLAVSEPFQIQRGY